MCGIAAVVSNNGHAAPIELGLLAHRGPDSNGQWFSSDSRVWLGHTRLAILDLSSAGAQPMPCREGRFTIVFNGEIYNHLEVRAELPEVRWRSDSDTETLVEAWTRWGSEALNKLRGMFAFAIYDARDASVTLARDRLGIKPLYYRREADSICVASEVRAFEGGGHPNLEATALVSYLATGHLPDSGTLGGGIQILPPGHWMRVDRNGHVQQKRWWPAGTNVPSENVYSFEEACDAVHQHVENAVVEHLLADVPVASFLSGGIDSSIVSLVAARSHTEPLRTFSVGFPQTGFDERPVARLVAERAGSRHTEIEVCPADCLAWVVEAVQSMDVPSVDAVNTFIVSKAVRREGIKVALSGLGADEIFGGYPSFQDVPRMGWLRLLPSTLVRSIVRAFPKRIREKLEGLRDFDPFSLALARRRWWSETALREAGFCVPARWPEPALPAIDTFAEISWAEILGYMQPMLLRDSDQMSMAVGLELRVPFLDHRLVEFAVSLPEHLKRGRPPKRLLIEAFRRELPQEVWQRRKQGFALPMDEWMRGPLKGFCCEGTDAAQAIFEPAFVRRVAEEFESRQMHWTRLWQIVVLGHYTKRVVRR